MLNKFQQNRGDVYIIHLIWIKLKNESPDDNNENGLVRTNTQPNDISDNHVDSDEEHKKSSAHQRAHEENISKHCLDTRRTT